MVRKYEYNAALYFDPYISNFLPHLTMDYCPRLHPAVSLHRLRIDTQIYHT